ncbi:hypothetical protein BT96DRAFT_826003 [Gymnopus androsaceus JB14]|uniref:SWIM-type domain-containing protein n=1 Tax=Gymnopus androsaceus JB14 TaxID=1447944 RepID=A0A6A4HEG8_9AGAR|nr:hypothetical protein BT96DRAFT_826003 [Gymnopus androsaceus JB14]
MVHVNICSHGSLFRISLVDLTHNLKGIGGPKMTLFQVFNSLNERTSAQSAQDTRRVLDVTCNTIHIEICYREMQESMFYTTTPLQRLQGVRDWSLTNNFTNDKAYVSTQWIIRLVLKQGLHIRHILRVKRLNLAATHYVIVLLNGRVIRDCSMGLNLGIPCRHYFQTFQKVEGLTFSIGMIRPRYVCSRFCR